MYRASIIIILALSSCSTERYLPNHCQEPMAGMENSWQRIRISKEERDTMIDALASSDPYHDLGRYEFWFGNDEGVLRLCSVPRDAVLRTSGNPVCTLTSLRHFSKSEAGEFSEIKAQSMEIVCVG